MQRPTDAELEEMERALDEAYPWFLELWPLCPYGHRMFQLGLNPEPAVVIIPLKGQSTTSARCVRCKRQQDREYRQRRKERERR